MVRFDQSKYKGGSRDTSSPRRGPSRRDGRSSRGREDFQKTKVTCASCGVECEVPFKPTSNKPVFCSECFRKNDKESSNKTSDRDLDLINEKLNKIMKALKIE